MTPAAEPATYVAAVLMLYVDLPETPMRYSLTDQALARKLHEDGVSLALVESAFLLATLRRLVRSADLPRLPRIRSLAYFLPVIDELRQHPLPAGYPEYLRLKLANVSRPDDQKSTFLRDR